MNRKQLVILLVMVVLVGGLGLVLYKRNNESYQPGSDTARKLLGDFPINDVARVAIKKDQTSVNLVKKNDVWTVQERNNYPANFDQISEFVRKAQELKIVQTEAIGPSQRARMELAEQGAGSGTRVDFKDASDKSIKSFYLGKTHEKKSDRPSPYGGEGGFPDGRWILLPDNAQTVFLVSDPLSNAQPKPENWLNKDFFKIEKVKIISLVSTNATNSWKLSRAAESDGWKLEDVKDGEVLDTNKVSGVANSLASPSFSDVAVNAKPEDTGLDKPTVLTMETFDGLTYTLKIGKMSGDENYFIAMNLVGNVPKERVAGKDEKKEDAEKLDKEFKEKNQKIDEKLKQEKFFENWTYLVPKWTLEPLLRDRAQLFVEKEAPKPDEATPPAP